MNDPKEKIMPDLFLLGFKCYFVVVMMVIMKMMMMTMTFNYK